MDITRQYVRQLLSESKKPSRKFEDSDYKYAYTTKDRARDGGWEVRDSIEELEDNWSDSYGELDPNNVLVMKPATSVDKAMVLIQEADLGGNDIYPSIDAAINGPMGLYALGWEEGNTRAPITEEEIQELLQTKDLKRAEELLAKAFEDILDYGYFNSLYEYVSGPMPEEDGRTPGKTLVHNKKQKASAKDFEYYKRRVLARPYNLKGVPDEFKTPELCKIAVENDGNALQFVPDKFKTLELCKIAVKHWGSALQYVPDKLKTPELCKFAVEQYSYVLQYIPDKLKTPEICKIAVENSGYVLKYIPDKLKTPELCKIAVENDGDAFEFVPGELKTPELCKLAVKKSSFALRYVPDKLKTLEICKIAVKGNGYALELVPDHLKEQVKQELGIE